MAQFTRMEVLNKMYEVSLIPVFYHPDFETAKNVVAACSKGGCKVIEFVSRGDHAYEIFSELVKYFKKEDPSLILGTGSICDPHTAALYINVGANFIVGPVLNADVAKICNRRKIPYSPGCGSASEVSAAEELGVEICKVFPGGQVGGPAFVKGIRGPLPWTSLMPTGGVSPTKESITEWVNAGVVCMGMGSKLVTKANIDAKDWDAITNDVKTALAIVVEAKANKK